MIRVFDGFSIFDEKDVLKLVLFLEEVKFPRETWFNLDPNSLLYWEYRRGVNWLKVMYQPRLLSILVQFVVHIILPSCIRQMVMLLWNALDMAYIRPLSKLVRILGNFAHRLLRNLTELKDIILQGNRRSENSFLSDVVLERGSTSYTIVEFDQNDPIIGWTSIFRNTISSSNTLLRSGIICGVGRNLIGGNENF